MTRHRAHVSTDSGTLSKVLTSLEARYRAGIATDRGSITAIGLRTEAAGSIGHTAVVTTDSAGLSSLNVVGELTSSARVVGQELLTGSHGRLRVAIHVHGSVDERPLFGAHVISHVHCLGSHCISRSIHADGTGSLCRRRITKGSSRYISHRVRRTRLERLERRSRHTGVSPEGLGIGHLLTIICSGAVGIGHGSTGQIRAGIDDGIRQSLGI